MREQEVSPGISVIGFDSVDEMLEYMVHEEPDPPLPPQEEITWGSYAIRLHHAASMVLPIWGRIFEMEEIMAEVREETHDLAEIVHERDVFQHSHNQGWRYGRWFSQVLPEGEYGSAHIVSCWPITQSDYEYAEANGWLITPEVYDRICTETDEALRKAGQPGLEEEVQGE